MAEPAGRYPLVRGRRRRRGRRARWAAALTPMRSIAGGVLVAAALLAGIALHGVHADPRAAYRDGLAALREGRFGQARTLLQAASVAEPGLAQTALARVGIETGDGDAAEAALQRAAAAGIAPARLHQLRAAALLLQDDVDGALAEADRAASGHARFVGRVRARALAARGDAAGAERVLADLLADAPADAGAWVDLGRVRLARGDVGGAGVAAARALTLDGGAPAALTLQGEVMRSRYGPAAAIPWFDAALARDPGFVAALVPQAAALGEVGRAREAVAAARAAMAARPAALPPRYLMAVIAARAGDVGLARRVLQTMDDAADAVPGALLLGGWLAQAEGHDDIAIAKWQQLLDVQPMNVVLRRLLGLVLLRSGDARGALDMLAPLVARGDADSEALETAARAARTLGDPRAAALHDRAIGGRRGSSTPFASDDLVSRLAAAAAAPDDPLPAVALVRGLLANGDIASAIARARAMAEASPGVASAQLVWGDALAAAGRWAEAARVYARAADLNFDESVLLRLVDAQGRAGRAPDAANTVTLYLTQNPQSLVARRLAGHWQAAAGDRRAVGTLEALRREVGARDAALLADLAVAWGGRDPHRALRYAAAAYRLAPMNRGIVLVRAAALARAGHADGARQLAAKAAALAANGG